MVAEQLLTSGCWLWQSGLLFVVAKHRNMASSGKFDGVDFSQIDIEPLTSELSQLGQGFRCVRGEFVTYWKQGRIQREAYDVSGFYEKLGFEFANPTESLPPVNPYRTMYLDLKPLIETLAIEELDSD